MARADVLLTRFDCQIRMSLSRSTLILRVFRRSVAARPQPHFEAAEHIQGRIMSYV